MDEFLEDEDIEPIELEIDGVLDLHAFHPREVKNLIPDYVRLCQEKGIYHIRIIHGKGRGELRRTVQAILKRLPEVLSFKLGAENGGGWGATTVTLKKSDQQ